MRYFISDLHFGHSKILQYQKETRKFPSVEVMDEHMISTWNKHVHKKDLIYVVGDFCFYRKPDKIKEIVSKLNGRLILIRGNHDKSTTSEYIEYGFEEVYDELQIQLGNETVLLKHYPYDSSFFIRLFNRITGRLGRWKNYYQFYPIDKGMYLIHGHHHAAPFYRNRQFNVNVDTSEFKPISETTIMNIIALEKGKNFKYKFTRLYKRLLTLFR